MMRRVLGIDAAFDGMAAELDIELRMPQPRTAGDRDLLGVQDGAIVRQRRPVKALDQ